MFKEAPFGLKPMSSKFQQVTHMILGDLWFVLAYIDDIVIFSQYEEDHYLYIIEVIERLMEAGLWLNLEKCHFYRKQIHLLGFIITPHGIILDPNKLVNIQDWNPPTTVKQVMHYLGLFNYFWQHIPLISHLTAPRDTMCNSTNFPDDWTVECQMNFDTLKALLPIASPLSFPDFDQPFCIATDASDVGISAVLY